LAVADADPISRNKLLKQRDSFCRAMKHPHGRRIAMRKTILTLLGSALLAASTVQIAAAAEQHKSHRVHRAPAPVSQSVRDSNAYYAPAEPSYAPAYPWVQPDWSNHSRYEDVPAGPPAGH
jgi:hypothetical protein